MKTLTRSQTVLAWCAFNAAWLLAVGSSASPLDGYWEGYIRDPHGSPVLKFRIQGSSQVTYCRVVVDPFFWHWEGVGTYSYSSGSKTFQMTLYYTNFNGYVKPKTPLGYFTGRLTATDTGRRLEGTMQFAGSDGPSGDTYNWDANAPPPPDLQRPAVKISSPANGARLTNSAATVTGTASDNVRVASVWYQHNTGAWERASGTTNWTAQLTLSARSNVFRVYALDAAGNSSLTNSLSLTYVLTAPLAVQTTGRGTVTPNYNGTPLELGKLYTMTATPAPGFAFANWTGSLTTNKPALTFVMASNLAFTANFVDAQKPVVTITSPKAGLRVSNCVFTVTGQASDNVAVAHVFCQLNTNSWTPASTANGWTNWTAAVTLRPGANTVRAYAVDTAGNPSKTNAVSFACVASATAAIAQSSLLSTALEAPPLEIRLAGAHVVLSWPACAGWRLEAAHSLPPLDQWTAVTNPPAIEDFRYIVIDQASGGARFYRLRQTEPLR